MAVTQREYTFSRKSDAIRTIKRLWDHSLVSRRTVNERGHYVVSVHVPEKFTTAGIDGLVERIRSEVRA
jgi:hypothetical protein